MTILVTGGAGFIGSHLVERLLKRNRVIVYDNYSSAVVPKQGIVGDILDTKKLKDAMAGVDIVYHLAVACVRLSLGNPKHVHEVNATGTLSTLLAAQKAGIKKFIYISSSEVYGSAVKPKIDENHPINPTTVYGMSKYIGELYTKLISIPYVIIRPFNTYGPRAHFDSVYGEVIPRFCVRVLSGKPPIIYGDGNQTRDFTYISDTIDGIIGASSLVGQTLNIAYGAQVSINEIAQILGAKPIYRPARPNDVRRHLADTTKARQLLDWKPKISIKVGIGKYLDWLKKTYPNPKKLLKLVPERNW